MSQKAFQASSGFTLLEVVIALAIMMIAFSSILAVQGSSINATTRAKQMNVVAMLARNQMIETEYKIQGRPFLEIPKEQSGEFLMPYQDYRWKTVVKEIQFPNFIGSLSGGGAGSGGGGSGGGGGAGSNAQNANQMTDLIGSQITQFLSKAIREVTVTVYWKKQNKEQSFTLSSYWVNLNHELTISQ